MQEYLTPRPPLHRLRCGSAGREGVPRYNATAQTICRSIPSEVPLSTAVERGQGVRSSPLDLPQLPRQLGDRCQLPVAVPRAAVVRDDLVLPGDVVGDVDRPCPE